MIASAAAGGVAWACGPEFKQLLLDRAGALTSLIVSDFAADAQQMVKPKDKALPLEPNGESVEALGIRSRETAEGLGLSTAQAKQIAAMRQAGNGDAAYKLGQGLPDGVRLYTAGAVDFYLMGNGPCHPPSESDSELVQENESLAAEQEAAVAAASGASAASSAASSAAAEPAASAPEPAATEVIDESADPSFKRMEQRFEAVLKLPASARQSRAAWAAFSLGRAHVEQCHTADALRYFQATRQLIREGADDPLYLGVASLGEEARVQWHAQQAGPAVALYAEQAGRGSRSGVNSLRRVAAQLLTRPDLLQPWLNDPLVQRVVVRYALSQADLASFEAREQRKPAAASIDKKKPAANSPPAPLSTGAAVVHLLDALTATTGSAAIQVSEPDALAAVAYAVGRDEQALKLAGMRTTVLSEWVLAKLALRSGSNKAAADHYAAAVKLLQNANADKAALPAGSSFVTEEGPDGTLDQVLRGEQGFMSLSRGDFVQALAQLYSVGKVYWLDLAYVAERVVTTNELKAFVDANVPQPPLPKVHRVGDQDYADPEPGAAWPASNAAAQLRALLARRLMRDGRFDDAYDYFPAPGDKRFGDPDARQHAREFVGTTQSARKAWTKLGKAQELFNAATLMREHGMDLIGYELGPDSTAVNGWTEVGTPEPAPDRYATLAERERFKASAAKPDLRYHYRVRAAELAAQAAQALPPRSQAYAASLCHATGWLLSVHDVDGARALYQQYVKNGPAVEWATHFGHDCPEPDFEAARQLQWRQQARELRLWARHHKPLVYGGLVLAVAGAVALALKVRRRLGERRTQAVT